MVKSVVVQSYSVHSIIQTIYAHHSCLFLHDFSLVFHVTPLTLTKQQAHESNQSSCLPFRGDTASLASSEKTPLPLPLSTSLLPSQRLPAEMISPLALLSVKYSNLNNMLN